MAETYQCSRSRSLCASDVRPNFACESVVIACGSVIVAGESVILVGESVILACASVILALREYDPSVRKSNPILRISCCGGFLRVISLCNMYMRQPVTIAGYICTLHLKHVTVQRNSMDLGIGHAAVPWGLSTITRDRRQCHH